ncbi:MAG: nucleotidyltransferase domain-containing protein [Acidimicrobiales bacterium]
MDFSLPGSVLCSSATAAALEVVVRAGAAFSGREVQRLSGVGTHPTITAALERLVGHGLVHREIQGRSYLYRFNREHLAAPAAVALATLYDSFLSMLRHELATWKLPAVHASLFGSLARHSGGPGSDIDLLLVRPDRVNAESAPWLSQVDALEGVVNRSTGNTLS